MSFPILIARFVNDLERGGATVIREDDTARMPARLRVVTPDATLACLVFLWNITRGGGGSRSRPANERRVQVTGTPVFPLEPGCRTIVGGWSEEIGVWGFWDALRHTRFSRNSPSFQVRLGTLEDAFHHGIATLTRRTTPPEIALAVHSDYLLWYLEQGEAIHSSGDAAPAVAALVQPTPEEERDLIDTSTSQDEAIRRVRLVEVMRRFRAARFRPEVLRAYSHQCAACAFALNLVDAAHLVPVRSAHSTDEVTNGVALCRLHHAAYDNGLLGIRPDLQLILSDQVIARLQELHWDHGLSEFRNLLLPTLRVPQTIEVRPDPEYLRRGMQERNWSADQIG